MRRPAAISRTCLVVLAGVIALACLSSPPLMAQETMQVVQNAPGFKAATAYQNFGDNESVNLANGGLTVTHPSSIVLPQNLGGTLRPVPIYNSKNPDTPYEQACTDHEDSREGFFGMGWSLSYGRVFLRIEPVPRSVMTDPYNYVARVHYFYRDESGAEHQLYLNSTLEQYNGAGDQPNGDMWYLTNDSSFIRARYNTTTSQWTLFFPDGSTRVAGGQNAYVVPNPGCRMTNIDGSTYYLGLKNLYSNGWYVTGIMDPAGNPITISYAAPGTPAQTPYPGTIDTITDQFGRTITFVVTSDTGTERTLLVSGAGATETYTFTKAYFADLARTCYVLDHVTDAEDLTTSYSYQAYTSPLNSSTYLSEIHYPAGAVSRYQYGSYDYTICHYRANPNAYDCSMLTSGTAVSQHTLTIHVLDPTGAASANTNTLAWAYSRAWNLVLAPDGQHYRLPVVVTDPLGTMEVHLFSVDNQADGSELSPGRERVIYRLAPGTTVFDPANPTANRIFAVNQDYSFGDRSATSGTVGDSHLCHWDSPTGEDVAPNGNPRVYKRVESEFDTAGAAAPTWTRATLNQGWNGYGHYCASYVYGTGTGDAKVSATEYNVVIDGTSTPPVYRLNQAAAACSGTMSAQSIPSGGSAIPGGGDPPDPASLAPTGSFKAEAFGYDSNGLLNAKTSYQKVQTAFSFNFGSLSFTTPPDPGADAAIGILRTSSPGQSEGAGNIRQITYSGGTGAKTYSQTIEWNQGMATSLQWGTIGYPEFSRSIDESTSRITSDTGVNGQTTSFYYDQIGRITKIAPQGEYPIQVEYPLEGDGTAHRIRYYRGETYSSGAAVSIPSVAVGESTDGVSGFGTKDVFSEYAYDDLGRLWRTDSVLPSGTTWTESTTFYDPLGRAVFTSEPYLYGTLTTAPKTRTLSPSGAFVMSVPAGAHSYGTWNTIFNQATRDDPFAGVPDPFYRPLRNFEPDGSLVQTAYAGLSSTVTMKVKTGAAQTDSSTQYDHDVLGRLLLVTPHTSNLAAFRSAQAQYAYNGFGRLSGVTLIDQYDASTQQGRSFTYDALGHLLSATNPENGTMTDMVYDALGNLLTYKDATGSQIDLDYDAKGRILTKGLHGQPQALINWDYDQSANPDDGTSLGASRGQLTHTETPWSREFYTYSTANGRLLKKALTLRSSRSDTHPLTYPVNYDYDEMGNTSTEDVVLSNGTAETVQVNSSYTHGLLTQKVFAGSLKGVGLNSDPITYFPSGAPQRVPYSNGTVTTYLQQDDSARLKSITASYVGGTWTTGDYAYDGAGNITGIGSNSFVYDSLSRLTQATLYHQGSAGAAIVDYHPDAFGNLLSRHTDGVSAFVPGVDPSTPDVNFTAAYNATTNRIQSFNGSTTAIVYDGGSTTGNGLVTADGTFDYSYDALNQLLKATLKTTGAKEDYGYDAAGERVYSQQGTSQATYFIRSGSQVLAEDKYIFTCAVNSAVCTLSSHRKKGYLYFASQLAASEDWEVAGTSTLAGGTTQNAAALCSLTYASNGGLTALPTLGEPQLILGHGTNYEADYAVNNVGPDVAGLVVRIARIKDLGAGQGSGGNGNGTPRNDEDQVQYSFYLQRGLNPDFVFHRYGLARSATYGTIGDLNSGGPITAAFPGLQTGKSYRFTLAIWTEVGANVNLGYNLVILEEGELSVPKDHAKSYLFAMNRDQAGPGGRPQGYLHARWEATDFPDAVGYNLLAPAADGAMMILNDTLIKDTEWTGDLAVVRSRGVSPDAPLSLEIVGPDGTVLGPISCGNLNDCDTTLAKTTNRPCIPGDIQAMNFSLPGSPRVYFSWTPCSTPGSGYRVYRGKKTGSLLLTFSLLATTTNPYYWDTTVDGISTYCYKVQSVGIDGITLSYTFSSVCVDTSVAPGVPAPMSLRAVNMSTGGLASRSVKLVWQWPGETPLPGGFSFAVYRAMGIQASSCSDVAPPQYQLAADGLTTQAYTDTAIGGDPNPLVAYEVAVTYTGAGPVSPISACAMTHVDACATLPQAPVAVQGSFDTNLWRINLFWSPAPDAGAWTSYELYGSYQPIAGTTYFITGYACPISGPVTFGVVALDSRTGCRSLPAYVTVIVPTAPCTPASAPTPLTLTMSGQIMTLTWSPVMVSGPPYISGYDIWIGYGACGTAPQMNYRASVNAGTTTYQDVVEPGAIVAYQVRAITGSNCLGMMSTCVDTSGGTGSGPPPTSGGDAESFFYVTDHLGTVRLITDTNGALVSLHDYEPYGVEMSPILPAGNSTGNTHQFTGQERDFFTGIDYMHARYYGSNLARFMRPDPVNGKPADPQSFNLYAYVGNNPITRFDPLGLMWFKIDGKWTFLKGVDKVINNTVDAEGKAHTKTVIGLDSLVTFDGKTLTLFQKDGASQSFEARAGKVDAQGNTQPSLQNVKDVGPIPEGTWTFSPKDIQRYSDLSLWQKFKSHFGGSSWPGGTSSWGNERAWLKPETYQGPRDSFTIHGGDEFGSRGCIDLAKNGPAFFSAVDTTLDTIPVFVSY